MKDGFITVATATPQVAVADCEANTQAILACINEMAAAHAKVMVLPELCITGYTCSDLFWQTKLLDEAEAALSVIAEGSRQVDALIAVGMPLRVAGKLLNVAAILCRGKVLGFVPKVNLPAYNEFYETRHFMSGSADMGTVQFGGEEIPVGTNLLFSCENVADLCVAAEICEDLWVPDPPSVQHALAGASVICNLSASDEMVGKGSYRRDLVAGQSARLVCAYLYATAGEGESTTDLVFGGQNLIAENGTVLAESATFENEINLATIDVQRLASERRRMSTFPAAESKEYREISFALAEEETKLARFFDADPFVPSNADQLSDRCEEILNIQALGLKKRLAHTHAKSAVVGISGLDSTLALLVTARAFDMLGLPRKGIVAVTMPGFGTTDRTYNNAVAMIKSLGATFKEVPIAKAVMQHFADIDHDASIHDVTYENSQARERTQILMDIANQANGFVIGTGDLSELALGWATYNGDHMSMYGVNAGVPKTLVRVLVNWVAHSKEVDETASRILLDVLDTPISPELLPPDKDGKINQKTEDLVGPYELHDFFLFHILRFGFRPAKVLYLAEIAFDGSYDRETLLKWLKNFYRRFFVQQFKRSCLPDGPKVGALCLSPRSDWRMPSDAFNRVWMEEVEKL